MTDTPGVDATRQRDRLDALFSCLGDRERRRILGIVRERAAGPPTRRDLASRLVAARRGTPDGEPDDEAVQQALVDLHHVHLPKLEAAGLIDVDSDRATVTVADHPAFRDEGIVDAIGCDGPSEHESLDALFPALADDRRRTVLDVLSHQFQPIRLETLAREIGARERDVAESDVPRATLDRILVSLRHGHLQKLTRAGLITYDAAERTVEYRGHPALRVPWTHSTLGPEFRASLTGESEVGELGTIDGRERVVSFGQSLCDRAEEELFCMFTATDLLEAGCLTRIRDASRRGVVVSLGTCDPVVREHVRENAPEVALWEPDTSWPQLPVDGGTVGRLLLADREAVMLGTLRESVGDEVHEEKAIVGEGADNALVVMIRQLASHHREQADPRAEDVQSRLPF